MWDQEVRGGGNAQMTKNVASFQAKYPNIKIKRVSRSFDDLSKTLRLALSGNDAPDIVQANNTRSQMGQFVKAGQLIPLDPWMKAYGWDKRYSQSLRSVVSYSPDAKTFGSGNLWIAYAWPNDWVQMKKKGLKVVYMRPKEKPIAWWWIWHLAATQLTCLS